MIKLMWHGEVPSTENFWGLEETVIEDIKRNLKSSGKPSDLIFHHIFLTDNYRGPSVLVWGKEGDDEYYHCEYHYRTEWQSLDEEKVDL